MAKLIYTEAIFKEQLKLKRPGLTLLEYTNTRNPATVRCKNGHYWTVPAAGKLLRIKDVAHECPYCSGYYKNLEQEAIGVIAPELLIYFVHQDDAFKYTKYSGAIVKLQCPICHIVKMGSISNLYQKGFSCPICADGITLPNKMIREVIREVIDQVQNYRFEYKAPWLTGGKSYDAYFEKDGLRIACEMQGPQHYSAIGIYSQEQFLMQVQRDQSKRLESQLNNVIEIEIPSLISELKYQRDSILKSDLTKYLDLSKINWNDIFYKVSNPLINQINILYIKGLSTFEIHKQLDICQATVIKYLKISAELGLVKYKPYQIITSKEINNIK